MTNTRNRFRQPSQALVFYQNHGYAINLSMFLELLDLCFLSMKSARYTDISRFKVTM